MKPEADAPALCVGILVADVVVPPLARLPAAGELIASEDFLVQPGGCAANSAIALRKLGVDAAVVGRVGDAPGDYVEIFNGTSTDAQFAPAMVARRYTSSGTAFTLDRKSVV